MTTPEHPYASFLHQVEKPARYAGGEFNQVEKDWTSVVSRFAFCFPDVYELGMSHLGGKILYSVVNGADDLLMERVFCPWIDMEAELLDSMTGERIGAIVDMSSRNTEVTSIGEADEVFGRWARRLRKRLDESHGR